MSIHQIPDNVDEQLLYSLVKKYLRGMKQVIYANGENASPTAIEFDPDLSAQELNTLAVIFVNATSRKDFDNLPNWSTWTAVQATDYVHSNILNGMDQAAIDTYIAGLPATIAGMKTGLTQLAYAIISIRTILEALSKAVIYIRNILTG